MRKPLLAAFLLIVATVPSLNAQSKPGTLRGIVQDQQKAELPGARLTITNAHTQETYKILSNEVGQYKAELPAGIYTITAEIPGFNTAKIGDVRVRENESTKLD